MAKRIHFFLGLFSLISFLLCGQNDLDNHKKYWWYKSRLHNDFMKVDATATSTLPSTTFANNEGHGESIPFVQRGFQPRNDAIAPSQILRTGDAAANLGIYLAVLASEYKLLKLGAEDVTAVKHEIFCALNAINRLDFFAEPIAQAAQEGLADRKSQGGCV